MSEDARRHTAAALHGGVGRGLRLGAADAAAAKLERLGLWDRARAAEGARPLSARRPARAGRLRHRLLSRARRRAAASISIWATDHGPASGARPSARPRSPGTALGAVRIRGDHDLVDRGLRDAAAPRRENTAPIDNLHAYSCPAPIDLTTREVQRKCYESMTAGLKIGEDRQAVSSSRRFRLERDRLQALMKRLLAGGVRAPQARTARWDDRAAG
jgi:hypothetical protein